MRLERSLLTPEFSTLSVTTKALYVAIRLLESKFIRKIYLGSAIILTNLDPINK